MDGQELGILVGNEEGPVGKDVGRVEGTRVGREVGIHVG